MKHVRNSMLLAVLLVMTSACAGRERLRIVSDFCINDRPITVEVAPSPAADDPVNRYDSDETVNQVLEHNAVRDRLCPDAVNSDHS